MCPFACQDSQMITRAAIHLVSMRREMDEEAPEEVRKEMSDSEGEEDEKEVLDDNGRKMSRIIRYDVEVLHDFGRKMSR